MYHLLCGQKVLNILKNFNHWLARRPCDPGALPLPRVSPGGWRWRFVAPGGELVAPGGLCQARRRPAATAPAAPSALASENAHRTSVHPKTLRELNMGVEASHPRSRVPGLAASALLRWCCELRGLVTTCQLSPSKEHHTRRTCPSNCLKGIIPACSDLAADMLRVAMTV